MSRITLDISGGGAIDDLRAANRLHGAVTGLLLGGDGLEDDVLAELTGTLDLISSVCIDNMVYQVATSNEEKTQKLVSIMNDFASLNCLVDDEQFMTWFVEMLSDSPCFEKLTVKSLLSNLKGWHKIYLDEQENK